MAAEGGSTASRSLQNTPTWALAIVIFFFIAFSIFIEHSIHRLSRWLRKNRKTSLFEAVEKLKSVLIVLGFMSLILTFTQYYIIRICITTKLANTMLPCSQLPTTKTTKAVGISLHERRLNDEATGSSKDYCGSKGMTSLISKQGLNQLSIFIFVLAVMQIVYSVLTMALGRIKMRRWKSWEKETQTVEYQAANDPNRFRFTRETTFGRRHMNSWTSTILQLWVKCFFRQFFNSVAKVDYLTLRLGFISAHLSQDSSFDFRKYIQRSLDDDFKYVVGISPFMWFLMVIFMLVDVHGWRIYLWVSFLPLLIVLIVGTKLGVVVEEMALLIKDQNSVIRGAILVQPNDNLFWFSHPKFVLTLMHYTLFMNAYELAFFIWVTLQFGIKSCYHEHKEIVITRVVLAVTVQFLCSYITLPLYALVTQMGSQFKSAMLEEQTADTIKAWHARAKEKGKKPALLSPPGHGSSSPINPSVRSISYNETSVTSIQAPTFASERSTGHAQEIVEHAPDESNPPIISHAGVQIELSHRTPIQTSLESDAMSTGNAVT